MSRNTERLNDLADFLESERCSGFDMRRVRSGCGTKWCIAGWTTTLYAEDDYGADYVAEQYVGDMGGMRRLRDAGPLLGLDEDDADVLFYPDDEHGAVDHATRRQAAKALRLLATRPDMSSEEAWKEALQS